MTLAAGSSTRIALRQATRLQPPEHREQEIDREQPNENYLPEAQVARRPMIGHHFRISIEESFPDAEDVGARHENDYQTDAEHDPQCQYRIAVRMDDCEGRKVHHRKDRRRPRYAQLSLFLCRPETRLFLERGPNASKRSTPKCRDEINHRQRDYTGAREAELLLASSDRQADSSRPGSEKSGSNQPNEPPLGFVKFAPPQHSSKW